MHICSIVPLELIRCGKAPEAVTAGEAAEFADFGNAVASVCVRKHGAIPAMPDMAQVMEQLKEERL